MDVSCLSLPPKLLAADKLRPKAQTTPRVPVLGRDFVECSLYVQLINIERFFLICAFYVNAQVVLYKTGPLILSSSFQKMICETSLALVRLGQRDLSCPQWN